MPANALAPAFVRSGKIAIWPYILRELPLSPVEALRLELQPRERNGEVAPSEPGAGTRRGVEYLPSCLVKDDGDSAGWATRRAEQEHGPRTDSDLGALKAKQELLAAGEAPPFVAQTGHVVVPSVRRVTARRVTDSNASPAGPDSTRRRLPSDRHRRPTTSGSGRRPPVSPLVEAVSSLSHRGVSDRVECPSGCGEEVRMKDLRHHQASLCALRYVRCLMPGCPTLIQARLLRLHLRQDCLKRKAQRVLASKGKALDTEIACRACDQKLTRKHLRTHLETDCQMRMVRCLNCKEAVQARSLVEHHKLDCKTVKRKAAGEPTEEECAACRETMATTQLRRHACDECPSRIVACPNKALGCREEFPASKMASHLRKQCVVLIRQAERASKYMFRRQRVRCSGCGYSVVLQHLDRHQREKCSNRRVPCKHWELGCSAMLRLSAMHDHLKVDRLLDPRTCLAFDGGRAYISLAEDDRKPPWTAEMWIWRPGLVEGTREKARTALKALWEFQRARRKLAVTERRLALLEPLLVDVATRAAKERSEQAEKTRDKLTDEMINAATVRDDAKVDLVVSVVVLSNNVASAARGVEEITAQDRLRGFDRLALGSTPWYAAATGPSGAGLSRDERALDTSRTQTSKRHPPLALSKSNSEREAVVQSIDVTTEVAGKEELSPGPTGHDQDSPTVGTTPIEDDRKRSPGATNTTALDPDGAHANNGGGLRDGEEDLDRALLNIAKEQQALEVAEEEALLKKEAEYWAEWIALTGPSLARKILALAGETLPRLKQEAAAIAGVASEALFDGHRDEAVLELEGTIPNEEGSAQAQASSASAKQREKEKKAAKKSKRKQKHEKKFGKNIETRIAEEVGKRGGVETLLGSDKVLFQLEMGPKERIGIKIAGKKDQIFNYRCPRERWVHLAFVSDPTGVFLLENGKTASRLRDIAVALPMREIGGRETACQCLLQEVRYWKVKRSKEDLVGWMHQVLPCAATNDGLIGYWTFEEGGGEYVNDVTEKRCRARKIGRGLKWAVSENMCTVEVGAPPTPSWREQNVCKVRYSRRTHEYPCVCFGPPTCAPTP